MKSSIKEDLTHRPPCCRRLLNPVTTKAVHKDEIPDLWVPAYDGILVECIVIIKTSPCALDLKNKQINKLLFCRHLKVPSSIVRKKYRETIMEKNEIGNISKK